LRTRIVWTVIGCASLAFVLGACENGIVQSREVEVRASTNAISDASLPDSGLSWSTFDEYPYEDIGSGLYIRIYEIGGGEQLRVSGTSMKLNPMGIAWIRRDGTETTIKGQEEWDRVREQIAMN